MLLNVYAVEINATQAGTDMSATRACGGADHFHVVHGGSAVACDIASITIEAHDAAHVLVPQSGVTLALGTSSGRGSWSNVSGGALNVIANLGGGAATYAFGGESAVTFGLQDLTVESLTVAASAGSVTTTSGTGAVSNSTTNERTKIPSPGFVHVGTSGRSFHEALRSTGEAGRAKCAKPSPLGAVT